MKTVRLELSNMDKAPLTIVLEPWAVELPLLESERLTVVSDSECEDPIQIHFHGNTVLVFGTRGSYLEAYRGDACIWKAWERLPL